MTMSRERVRRMSPALVALLIITLLYNVGRMPRASASERAQIASKFAFQQLPIAMPPGYTPKQTYRQVNPAYQKLQGWLSSVGASIAMGDFDGKGLDDDICLVDPRTDEVVLTYAPTAPASARFTPFALDPAPLPMDSAMAPTSCTPGDYTGDGRIGFLVTYLGRTPIMFLAKSTATALAADSYKPVEVIPATPAADGLYHGPRWQTTTVHVADLDGSGHPDLFIGNYFPDSDVLDPHGENNVVMNTGMSNAKNAGGDHVMRWMSGHGGTDPDVSFVEERDALPFQDSTGWTLAIASADLTGDGLPDVYVANDFGRDHLFHNVSTPGHIKFKTVDGQRTPTTPKSFVLGHDSFKGMGVDFGDMQDNGRFDMAVGNITTAYGLEESNFLWMNDAKSQASMKSSLDSGIAPFTQEADNFGFAQTGWSWDVKFGDFANDGSDEIVQTDGFVQGGINRWAWLQELATANDEMLTNPAMWPNIRPGDDVAGHQSLAFYAKGPTGSYHNINRELGLYAEIPTRGVAFADTTGTGALDLAVARQWGPPAFYHNVSPHLGNQVGFQLYRPSTDASATAGQNLENLGAPAYGATVQISYPGHTQISQLDGGSGHTGRRSFEVRFGVGTYTGPVTAHIQWRDNAGALHQQTMTVNAGTHNLMLTDTASEVTK